MLFSCEQMEGRWLTRFVSQWYIVAIDATYYTFPDAHLSGFTFGQDGAQPLTSQEPIPSPSARQPKHAHLRSYRRTRVREALDRIPTPDDIHERYAGNLAHAPPQLAVARRDDEALVRGHSLHEAVVCIRARMRTRKTLEAWVSRNARRERQVSDQDQRGAGRARRREGTYRRATRYRCPSFSSSAITQSVTHGMPEQTVVCQQPVRCRGKGAGDVHLAYRQSIMPLTSSSLF